MKLILWVLEHFPSLAAWGFGMFEVTQHKPELAMLFFVMAALFEISGAIAGLDRNVKKLAQRLSDVPGGTTDTRDHTTGAHSGAQGRETHCRSEVAPTDGDAGQ